MYRALSLEWVTQNIDLSDDAVDYTVSGLLLNFIPDTAKALSEMVRIVRPGGAVALYVWDYAGQMQIMRYFFDAARVIDPKSSAFDDGINAPICRPKALSEAFIAAGLSHVETTAIDIPAAFVDFHVPGIGRTRLGQRTPWQELSDVDPERTFNLGAGWPAKIGFAMLAPLGAGRRCSPPRTPKCWRRSGRRSVAMRPVGFATTVMVPPSRRLANR